MPRPLRRTSTRTGWAMRTRGLTVSEAINNYASSEVVDEDTVTFRFSAPSPGFLQATSTINSGLLSPETHDGTIEDFGAGNAAEIIGSGPFTVTDEKLAPNTRSPPRDDYEWGPDSVDNAGRPYLDAGPRADHPQDSVRIGSLLAGQADYVRYVQAFDEDRVEGAGFTLYAPQTRGVNNSIALRYREPAAGRHPRAPGHSSPPWTRRRSSTRSSPRITRWRRRCSPRRPSATRTSPPTTPTTRQGRGAARRGGLGARLRRHPREGRRAPVDHGLRSQAAAAVEADARARRAAAGEGRCGALGQARRRRQRGRRHP